MKNIVRLALLVLAAIAALVFTIVPARVTPGGFGGLPALVIAPAAATVAFEPIAFRCAEAERSAEELRLRSASVALLRGQAKMTANIEDSKNDAWHLIELGRRAEGFVVKHTRGKFVPNASAVCGGGRPRLAAEREQTFSVSYREVEPLLQALARANWRAPAVDSSGATPSVATAHSDLNVVYTNGEEVDLFYGRVTRVWGARTRHCGYLASDVPNFMQLFASATRERGDALSMAIGEKN